MNKYTQNCGVCLKCKGLAKEPKCPTCGSKKARCLPYGMYGQVFVECDGGHVYDMAHQIDYDDVALHQKVLDERYIEE